MDWICEFIAAMDNKWTDKRANPSRTGGHKPSAMQKRARLIDNKMKRIHINRRGRSDIKDSFSMPLAYIRLVCIWLTVVTIDAFGGFRMELLWPFWMIIRAGYESMNKSQSSTAAAAAAAFANQNTAKFSVFFVCVTATSDLICYLFIPVRMIVLLGTTYVWITLLCHNHGGFIRTMNTLYCGDRSQSWLIVGLSAFIIVFEVFVRARCDLLIYVNREQAIQQYLPNGMPTTIPRSMNAFFGAHSIGYPVVLITFSLHYYFREWKMRRKQGDVAMKNEQLNRLLVEALPSVYEGPKDYRSECVEEECEMLELTQMAITYGNGMTRKNGYASSKNAKRNKKFGTPPAAKSKKDDDDDDEDMYEYERKPNSKGVWIVRLAATFTEWIMHMMSMARMEDDETDDKHEEEEEEWNRKQRVKQAQQQQQQPQQSHQQQHKKKQQNKNEKNGITRRTSSANPRDSSHDTTTSSHEEARSMAKELDLMRAELNSKRNNEEDMKLHITMLETSESRLSQTITHLKSRIEQLESKCATLEKHREVDKAAIEHHEQKYAQLMARKSELEQALIAERKARNEDTGKKMDLTEHQREKERQLEKEVDRLRNELKSKEDLNMSMETELISLRNYKEDNDIDALNIELRIQKEKWSHLETSMVSENKLKQELFRALGDAKENNKRLEKKIAELEAELQARPHQSNIDPNDDTTNSDQSSPQQHSAMGSPVPSSKVPLSINVNNRQSPFVDKLSPLGAPLGLPGIAPPTYQMAVQLPKPLEPAYSSYGYNNFQPHSSTGEHLLFDVPTTNGTPSLSPGAGGCGVNSHDLLAARMGKFGAPSNPARSN